MDDGGMAGENGASALEKAERCQWLIVGRIAFEIGIVRRFRQARFPWATP